MPSAWAAGATRVATNAIAPPNPIENALFDMMSFLSRKEPLVRLHEGVLRTGFRDVANVRIGPSFRSPAGIAGGWSSQRRTKTTERARRGSMRSVRDSVLL